jgi:hypothetical protein
VSTLAEIFQQYGPAYRAKYGAKDGERMLPSHRRAMADIEQCRTAVLGGHLYYCDHCQQWVYSYHSCQNRHCPLCQHQAGQQWFERQREMLLPTPYFMLTFTLPQQLRPLARSNQKLIYNLLFRTSAAALQELAKDPRFVGGHIGMIGVLQTWTRDMRYHPHIHFLVPAGGLSPDAQQWLPCKRKDFLVHVKPLSKLFRAKFRDELKKTGLFDQVAPQVWHKKWVVHCQAVGRGERALKYLAAYIFQVAISNNRIVKVENGQVTFRYKNRHSRKFSYCTLPAEKFIQRFLQHILPKGFIKVRYYGLFSPSYRPWLHQLRLLLTPPAPEPEPQPAPQSTTPRPEPTCSCPTCGQPMRLVATLKPCFIRPPPQSTASNLTAQTHIL